MHLSQLTLMTTPVTLNLTAEEALTLQALLERELLCRPTPPTPEGVLLGGVLRRLEETRRARLDAIELACAQRPY
jgi:hypothetical protein